MRRRSGPLAPARKGSRPKGSSKPLNAFSPGGISDDAKIDKGAELFSRDSHVWACKAGFSSANLYPKQVSKGGELGRSLMAMSLRQVAD
jgi:hypothetical protein